MTNAVATTVSRRGMLSRLLMAAAVAPVLGVTLAETVNADKKSKRRQSKQKRINALRDTCKENGGTFKVDGERPGGTTVTCTGQTGEHTNDWTCTVFTKGSRCHASLTHNPATNAGGGGAVPPSGGNEDPTGGGSNPGGGGHVPPSGGNEDPTDGGSQDPPLT